MTYSGLQRLLSRVGSADFAWLVHRIRLALRLVEPVSRPATIFSSELPPAVAAIQHTRAIKILAFSHNLDREGASISLHELLCGLKMQHGVEPSVVSFSDGPLRHNYQVHGISVSILPSPLSQASTVGRLRHTVRILAQKIREVDADIVFINTLLNFPAVLAAEEAGLPSIWNPRESESWSSYFRFLPLPVAQTAIASIGLPRKVVFVAEATRRVWSDFESHAAFSVVHNALNLSRFSTRLRDDKQRLRQQLGWQSNEVVFLNVGTLCDRKGQADIFQCLPRLLAVLDHPIRIALVGNLEGEYPQRLQRLAHQYKGHKNLVIGFYQALSDIGMYYRAADAFVLCSRVESYPRVILEALAFGLPIITTPVYGVLEQINEAHTVQFYEPGDIEGLAESMLALARSATLRSRLSACSFKRHQELETFTDMVDRYYSIICGAVQPSAANIS